MKDSSHKAFLALTLLIPAPTLGVVFGMILFPDTTLGAGLFFFCKVWLLGFPLIWRLAVEKKRPSLSPARHGGWPAGLVTGILIALTILAFWKLLGPSLIDAERLQAKMVSIGLTSMPRYIGMAGYWILINSLLEEYVWRWFVTEKFDQLCTRKSIAILFSALAFTLHHIVAMLTFFKPGVSLLCSFFIFVGGASWSALYLRYHSIWPAYLSHALADLAIFGIGGLILFA